MWPGALQKRSQIDSARPSAVVAPSIWYAEVEQPQRKLAGNSARRRASRAGTDAKSIVSFSSVDSRSARLDVPGAPTVVNLPQDWKGSHFCREPSWARWAASGVGWNVQLAATGWAWGGNATDARQTTLIGNSLSTGRSES